MKENNRSNQKSAEEIAEVLGGYRRGQGYMAHCPAHNDANPSLSLRDAERGKVLFYCFAGCSQEAVLKGLQQLGLVALGGSREK